VVSLSWATSFRRILPRRCPEVSSATAWRCSEQKTGIGFFAAATESDEKHARPVTRLITRNTFSFGEEGDGGQFDRTVLSQITSDGRIYLRKCCAFVASLFSVSAARVRDFRQRRSRNEAKGVTNRVLDRTPVGSRRHVVLTTVRPDVDLQTDDRAC